MIYLWYIYDIFMIYLPIGSMYGIYANIWGILMVNVTIYGIHGSYGIYLWYIYELFMMLDVGCTPLPCCHRTALASPRRFHIAPSWVAAPWTAPGRMPGTMEFPSIDDRCFRKIVRLFPWISFTNVGIYVFLTNMYFSIFLINTLRYS